MQSLSCPATKPCCFHSSSWAGPGVGSLPRVSEAGETNVMELLAWLACHSVSSLWDSLHTQLHARSGRMDTSHRSGHFPVGAVTMQHGARGQRLAGRAQRKPGVGWGEGGGSAGWGACPRTGSAGSVEWECGLQGHRQREVGLGRWPRPCRRPRPRDL